MPQLDPSSFASQIFWLIITFSFLYMVLSRVTLPRITSIFQDRNARIENDLSRAEQLKNDATQAEKRYQAILTEGREKAQKILQEAQADIQAEIQKRHHQMDETLASQFKEADHRIAEIKKKSESQLAKITDELSELIEKKIFGDVSLSGNAPMSKAVND